MSHTYKIVCACTPRARAVHTDDLKTANASGAAGYFWHFKGACGNAPTVEIDGVPTPIEQIMQDLGVTPTVQAAPAAVAAPPIPALDGDFHADESYVSGNGEVKALVHGIKKGRNVLLPGPTGCGKTHLVMSACKANGWTVEQIQGNGGATYEHIVGQRDLKNGDTVWKDGPLVKAMREGSVLYVDEPNALPDDIRFLLFSAMDQRRTICLPENDNEVVEAAPGFTVVSAMNEGLGYSGTTKLNFAFRRRYQTIIPMDYLSPDKEAHLIEARTGLDPLRSKQVVNVAVALRDSFRRREMRTPTPTSTLLTWAELMVDGFSPMTAAKYTILCMMPSDEVKEKNHVRDIVESEFAEEVLAE